MHIIVASDIEPTCGRAHAINVIKTAGGFHRLGYDVTVLCRDPGNPWKPEFGEPHLHWRCAPPTDRVAGDGRRGRDFGTWTAEVAGAVGADAVYARHFEAALACNRIAPTVLETHAYIGDDRPILDEVFTATHKGLSIATISKRLRAHYIARGAAPDRVNVVPDGVDVELFRFRHAPSPLDRWPRPAVVYAGHLYDYKGIPAILDAARHLPEVTFHLLGGLPEDITRVRAQASGNVVVHGAVPFVDVPPWLWSADALLLPPSAREPSAAWTSPVKLGEYLAAGPPIVATRIPALQDWVDAPVVTWCAPDDGSDLARAINEACNESSAHRHQRQTTAHALATNFSYEQRARTLCHGFAQPQAKQSRDPSPPHLKR